MDCFSFKKTQINKEGRQKGMGQKLMSKSDVESTSRFMYPFVSKNIFNKIHRTFSS